MNHVERFRNVMSFKSADRLPVIEWAVWWDKTIEKWHKEGLPSELKEAAEIRAHLGLDCYNQLWISSFADSCPSPSGHGSGLIKSIDDYRSLKKHLYPDLSFDKEVLEAWGAKQARGEMVIWFTLEGFFWHPRSLFGIEQHIYSFYDKSELMHQINSDLLDYHLKVVDQICEVCGPDFMTIAEDMSYNNGPMISKKCFDEFLSPYYLKLTKILKDRDILVLVDSDGNVTEMIPWLEEVGVEGMLPFERMSGCDVSKIRENHPKFRMIGGYDKTVMHLGPDAMRQEFEKLLPTMRKGGFIPSVDHQTPPDVSLENYYFYVSLLHKYASIACE